MLRRISGSPPIPPPPPPRRPEREDPERKRDGAIGAGFLCVAAAGAQTMPTHAGLVLDVWSGWWGSDIIIGGKSRRGLGAQLDAFVAPVSLWRALDEAGNLDRRLTLSCQEGRTFLKKHLAAVLPFADALLVRDELGADEIQVLLEPVRAAGEVMIREWQEHWQHPIGRAFHQGHLDRAIAEGWIL